MIVSRKIKKRKFLNYFLSHREVLNSCSNCLRKIREQQILVFKPKSNSGKYVCICQLYKYLNGKNEVSRNGKKWDYVRDLGLNK